MQRPCTPFSRVLNYSSSKNTYRTITSYTGTTIHQLSLVIPLLLLLNLLSRIVREKMAQLFDIFFLLLFCFLQQSWAPAKPAENSCSLQCGGSPKQKIWLSSFLEVEHPVLLIIWPSSGWWHFPVSWPLLACQNPAGRVSAEVREMSKDLLAHLAGTINPQTGHLMWQIYYKHTQNPVGKQVLKDFKAKLLPDQLTNVLVSFHAQDQGELPVVRMNAYK